MAPAELEAPLGASEMAAQGEAPRLRRRVAPPPKAQGGAEAAADKLLAYPR